MASMSDLVDVLRSLHERDVKTVRASTVAELLWPGSQAPDSGKQHLNAGVAGRMLRSCNLVRLVSAGQWQILGDRVVVHEVDELHQKYQLTPIQQMHLVKASYRSRAEIAKCLARGATVTVGPCIEHGDDSRFAIMVVGTTLCVDKGETKQEAEARAQALGLRLQ